MIRFWIICCNPKLLIDITFSILLYELHLPLPVYLKKYISFLQIQEGKTVPQQADIFWSVLALHEKYVGVGRCSSLLCVFSKANYISTLISVGIPSRLHVNRRTILTKIHTRIVYIYNVFTRNWLSLHIVKVHVSKVIGILHIPKTNIENVNILKYSLAILYCYVLTKETQIMFPQPLY